jgi:hypothetical protein
VAARPGKWRFVYTTSEYGFRAPTLAVSNHYDRPNVVVLGDSNSFASGVNDGEEYPAVLRELLAGRANVVNLAVPGYGLAQEIRLFYEFGQAYDPAIVVLQFCDNDPDGNLLYRVTAVEDGRFVFQQDQSHSAFFGSIQNYLSESMIQRSQLYNFVRGAAFEILVNQPVEQDPNARDQLEEFYNELLDVLVRDLDRRGIDVVFFGVNGHLGRFPGIAAKVRALSDDGLLSYLPSEPWFETVTDYASPEGHTWGAKGHLIVAQHLAPALETLLTAHEHPHRIADASRRPLAP